MTNCTFSPIHPCPRHTEELGTHPSSNPIRAATPDRTAANARRLPSLSTVRAGEPWAWEVASYKLAGGAIILLGNFLYISGRRAASSPGAPASRQ